MLTFKNIFSALLLLFLFLSFNIIIFIIINIIIIFNIFINIIVFIVSISMTPTKCLFFHLIDFSRIIIWSMRVQSMPSTGKYA